MDFDSFSLHQALLVLGEILAERNLRYEVVAVGGGGLLLLGMITRPTKDLDLIAIVDEGVFIPARPLPDPLMNAIVEVGVALKLNRDWINSGPSDLFSMGLPEGFMKRMDTHCYGGLILHLAGRFDQICFKLYAAVDLGPQSKHFADLKLLNPSEDELNSAAAWCKTHDVSEGFEIMLLETLAEMRS